MDTTDIRLNATRFGDDCNQLHYAYIHRRCWRVVHECKITHSYSCVGPHYATKEELLSDLESYARSNWGL